MTHINRPLSPHLQVYKPQLTSVLSITHRATGVILSLGALLFSLWLVALATSEGAFNQIQLHISAWYGKGLLLGFVFSLYYHLCNGIRHLFWDAGLGLDINSAYRSGYATMATSLLLTIITFGGQLL